MQILLEIPKEFESDYKGDAFKDFFSRVLCDIENGTLCGNYEKETSEMFLKAFDESKPIESVEGDLISRNALLKELESSEIQPTKDMDGFIDGWCEGFNTVVDMIRDAPTAYNDGWIPVSSGKLPEDCVEVDVTIEEIDGDRYTQTSWLQDGQWVIKKSPLEPKVIAWKERTEPYQPKGEKVTC